MSLKLSTVQHLAEFLNKSPSTIYSDTIRRPESLPPIVRLPGSSRLLFANMEEWAASFVSSQKSEAVQLAKSEDEKPAQRRRGRPTKAEEIANPKKARGTK